MQDTRADDQANRHRSQSVPATLVAADRSRAVNGFPDWSAQRMRPPPDLDVTYGSARPPRAKSKKASGIQPAERNPQDGMVLIHPGRIIVNPTLTPELSVRLQEVRKELRIGAVYKWNISRNGQLMLAKSKHPRGEKLGWGHPTLVGGLREPEARIGGELRFGKPSEKAPGPVFYINNDSGRYSEYGDRIAAMLGNVAIRFGACGFSVQTQWIDKSEEALKAQAERKSKKATQGRTPPPP